MPKNHMPRIDVWGSCVSRDTLEYMPDIAVGTYVARQSAIVSLSPADDIDVPSDRLDSDFQKRMLEGDRAADVVARLSEPGPALLLLDLVDERRGVWKFPSGSFLTNSVEAYHAGVEVWGPAAGARLIEFGTDEHFALWRNGFTHVARAFMRTGKPVILLDIAWAEVFEGQAAPLGALSFLASVNRRVHRRVSGMVDSIRREKFLWAGVRGYREAPLSPGDEHVRLARAANEKYRRYMSFAQVYAAATVSRKSGDVRMNKLHKWGIAPYHYSDCDYRAIRDDLYNLIRRT